MTLRIFFILLISFKIFAADCKKPDMPTSLEWSKWIENIKLEALKKGISEKTVINQLTNVKPQKKIILRDRCQPESTITLDEYIYYRVDKARILAGKKILKKHNKVLREIGEYFNIQPRFKLYKQFFILLL